MRKLLLLLRDGIIALLAGLVIGVITGLILYSVLSRGGDPLYLFLIVIIIALVAGLVGFSAVLAWLGKRVAKKDEIVRNK